MNCQLFITFLVVLVSCASVLSANKYEKKQAPVVSKVPQASHALRSLQSELETSFHDSVNHFDKLMQEESGEDEIAAEDDQDSDDFDDLINRINAGAPQSEDAEEYDDGEAKSAADALFDEANISSNPEDSSDESDDDSSDDTIDYEAEYY